MSVEGLPEVQGGIDAARDAILGRLKATISKLSVKLQARVKSQKLSGQVLNVRTGRLRRSISYKVEQQGDEIYGLVGTNVEYARRHEFGMTGDEKVRAHMRTIKEAFGKSLKNPKAVMVRAHSRHINAPERSFLRSALAEMSEQIQTEIAAAVAGGGSRGA